MLLVLAFYVKRNSCLLIINIVVNLDETLVDRDILELILYSYRDLDKDVKKVVFVGLSRRSVKLMKKIIRESNKKITYITACINDYEKAKKWLRIVLF